MKLPKKKPACAHVSARVNIEDLQKLQTAQVNVSQLIRETITKAARSIK